MTNKAPNYTPEQTAMMVEQYKSGTTVEQLAETLGKTVRSVRSKLVREGVYVAQEKAKARKETGATKKEILKELESLDAQLPVNGLLGASKEALEYLKTLYQK